MTFGGAKIAYSLRLKILYIGMLQKKKIGQEIMTYEYLQDTDATFKEYPVISSIKYTGHEGKFEPYISVDFTYETSVFKKTFFKDANLNYSSRRLKTITTSQISDGLELKRYDLTYFDQKFKHVARDALDHLKSIQFTSMGQSFPATQFTWDNNNFLNLSSSNNY